MASEARKNAVQAPRILIVDDDPGQRSLLDSFLSSQGFVTVPGSSGEQALDILRTGDISMITRPFPSTSDGFPKADKARESSVWSK